MRRCVRVSRIIKTKSRRCRVSLTPDRQVSRCVSAVLRHAQSLGQCPDVVMSEPQRFNLGEFCVFGQRRQDAPEHVQSWVQVVHPVALPVVRLHPAPAPQSRLRTSGFLLWGLQWGCFPSAKGKCFLIAVFTKVVWSFPQRTADTWRKCAECHWAPGCAQVTGSAPDCWRHPVQLEDVVYEVNPEQRSDSRPQIQTFAIKMRKSKKWWDCSSSYSNQ